MKINSLFRAVPVLFTLALSTPVLPGQVVVPIESRATDMAVAYLGGGNLRAGDAIGELSLGNINSLPTRQVGLLKFDITSFEGQSASNVTLNLPITSVINSSGNFPIQTVNIYTFDYALGATAFTVDDVNSEDVTLIGSLALSGDSFVAQFDLTSGFAAAQASGFSYFAIRMENITVLEGPFGQPDFVWATLNPTLSVTAVPEPSTYALLGLSLGLMVFFAKRRNTANTRA